MWGPGCGPVSGVFAKELQSLLLELMTIFRNICHVVVITSGAAPMEDGVHAPFLCKSLPLDEFSVFVAPPTLCRPCEWRRWLSRLPFHHKIQQPIQALPDGHGLLMPPR